MSYLLSDKTKENCLQIRAFTEAMKQSVYEKQTNDAKANNTSNCPLCAEKGIDKIYKYEEMEGDHIKPWSKGGHTEKDNLQMLCVISYTALLPPIQDNKSLQMQTVFL